jgi:hypothetical protein
MYSSIQFINIKDSYQIHAAVDTVSLANEKSVEI